MKNLINKIARPRLEVAITVLVLILAILLTVGFAPVMQGTQRFKEIITQTLIVTGNADLRGDMTLTDDLTIDDLTADDITADDVTFDALTAGGASALNGGITVDSTAFSVQNASGSTFISGTLAVSSTSVFTGAVTLPAGDVSATEIANISRSVPLPLHAFIECTTNGGANLDFTDGADTFPDIINSSTDGLGFVVAFDATTPDTTVICAPFTVPPDYASGGAIVARVTKGAETGANSELLTCAGSINGAALGATGTITTTGTASASYTCTPTLTSLAAGDSVSLALSITSGGTADDTVNLASAVFQYTATQ